MSAIWPSKIRDLPQQIYDLARQVLPFWSSTSAIYPKPSVIQGNGMALSVDGAVDNFCTKHGRESL